ncbi:MAG TPA: bacteriohopanetetrol glucosamine biosynthesis glycosyltransferase HpnI [Terracidiphilus sp.]|jgi:ceramide glucosyltransferase|nr:bacteriohopanetetrol glucosamine biosynthesis glycosyltransferase HpnI [Terracidiphilus sp.]
MPHALALAVEVATTALTVAGIGYFLTAWIATRIYLVSRRAPQAAFAPSVSILKSLKGLDPGMLNAFRSHCTQTYAGNYELLFGVASLDDPAVAAVRQLQSEFPAQKIQLIECARKLGTNGKVGTLAQLVPHAQHDFLLVNDSDITVSTRYLERVIAAFEPPPNRRDKTARQVGLVTAFYRGRAHKTLASLFEALTISTDFLPSVMLALVVERGLRYGLGSTLAFRREALQRIGGYEVLADYLADDYELGARIAEAGYRIAIAPEVVETGVPAYRWSEFAAHQLRWMRTVRDARPGGYTGLIFAHGLSWALLNVIASGASPLSLWLVALTFFLRLTLAMTVGAEVLGDHQVLPSLWLLPLHDLTSMGLWIAGFAGDSIVWRGEKFIVKKGKLLRAQ